MAGLSTRLAWTNQGWIEQLKNDDVLIGVINLQKVPPVAQVLVSKALEDALQGRVISDGLKQAIASAEGSVAKWVELALVGPEPAEVAANLVTIKTELVRSGQVPITASERTKNPPKPATPEVVINVNPPPSAPTVVKPAPSTKPSKPSKGGEPKASAKINKPVKLALKKKPASSNKPKPKAAIKLKPAAKTSRASKKKPAKNHKKKR